MGKQVHLVVQTAASCQRSGGVTTAMWAKARWAVVLTNPFLGHALAGSSAGGNAYRSCMHFWADCRNMHQRHFEVVIMMEVDLDVWDLGGFTCRHTMLIQDQEAMQLPKLHNSSSSSSSGSDL